MSREFTVYQATNPATDPETLARMAADRPDLRQFVAANPATPAAVVEWLGTLGDHAVDAALARRRPVAPPQPSSYAPSSGPASVGHEPAPAPPAPASGQPWAPAGPAGQPWGTAGQPWARPAGQPWAPGGPAGQEWASHGPAAQPWTSTGPAPASASYPSDAAGQAANPYAAPAAPYGGAAGYGGPAPSPLDAYGYQLPEPRGRRTGLVVAIVAGALLLVGALVFAFSSVSGMLSDDSTYGEDAYLDRLWDACETGDGQACDDLYLESPIGSGYEEFGDTCGNRFPAQEVWCVEVM